MWFGWLDSLPSNKSLIYIIREARNLVFRVEALEMKQDLHLMETNRLNAEIKINGVL